MRPQSTSLSALCASVRASAPRAFSTTAPAARPPREAHNNPNQQSATQSNNAPASSTSSLLSLNRPARRGPNHHHHHGHGESGSASSPRPRAADSAARMLERYREKARAHATEQQAVHNQLREQKMSNDYLMQMPRRWQPGDVYSPHDLSPVEMQKWRRRSMRNVDVIDALGLRPLDMYKNFSLISEFTRSSGQIIPATQTGLRPVNQRKIAKMVRRAQGMGIYPTIHNHPEMVREHFIPSTGTVVGKRG